MLWYHWWRPISSSSWFLSVAIAVRSLLRFSEPG
jgi:hypothetical protein